MDERGKRMNSGMYDLEKMAEFDLKKVWPYTGEKELDGIGLIKLLKRDLCGDSVELYINYKKNERSANHLDNSGGGFFPMEVLYNILWGRMVDEGEIKGTYYKKKGNKIFLKNNVYLNFRKSYIGEIGQDVLWGGDCINSVQKQLRVVAPKIGAEKSMYTKMNGSIQKIIDAGFSDICKLSGCIGNYVLVPAYFNVNRIKTIGKKDDNWQAALTHLQNNGWKHMLDYAKNNSNIFGECKDVESEACAKAEEIYGKFEQEYFIQYINTMFLWDYVRVDKENYDVLDLGHNKTDDKTNKPDKTNWLQNIHYAIKKRGIFMSAMLMITVIDKTEENSQLNKNRKPNDEVVEDWNEWKVSDIYKKIMKKVFCIEKVYDGYPEVFAEIDTVINVYCIDKECDKYKEIKSILENAQKLIVNMDKEKRKSQCPTKQETVNPKNTNKK